MILIDSHDAIDLLRAVVAEHGGGTIYTDTTGGIQDVRPAAYLRDGAPSCLVGRALHAGGFTLDRIAILDERQVLAGEIGATIGGVTPEAEVVLYAAQEVQDQPDETWGSALFAAECAYLQIEAQIAEEHEEYMATRVEGL